MAISRLPWLTALAAWGTCGTWTCGAHFVEDRAVWEMGPPDLGDVAPCRETLGLARTMYATFAVERRRGWTETADTPPRQPSDYWDELRARQVTMEKSRPRSGGTTRLTVRGYFAAFREGHRGAAGYEIIDAGRTVPLADAQWADWDADGRLLVATIDGRLQVRDYSASGLSVRSVLDVGSLTPAPSPPPEEAQRW